MIKNLNMNDEIHKVMKIWKEATIQAHKFISEEYWLNSYDVVKEQYIPMAETYVYLEENEIQGFISVLGEEHIGALFVDINCQGGGVGKKLINHTKKIYEKLTLEVYKKNEKAVGFYKKVGFIVKEENLNEETNEPTYVMTFEK
ncbi:N-acetyltransferase [Anaerophilus nitritogenes]|uniref:N-acetyltransferase n=1 Tax=Anaerophilus nitritogenes TaxID=2498136 RepID=UPI00101BC2CE|nr:N-acetyltransferase [Anaerophilus nitritogenes]